MTGLSGNRELRLGAGKGSNTIPQDLHKQWVGDVCDVQNKPDYYDLSHIPNAMLSISLKDNSLGQHNSVDEH